MDAPLRPGETLSVQRPEVSVVIDSTTGEELRVQEVIGSDYEQLLQLRMEVATSIKLSLPLYLCAECFTPVYLCCRRSTRRFFFRHTIEDGRCGAITRGELSREEITARKYNGAKESLLHRQMKQWLEESLRASGRFTDIAQEQRWPGAVTDAWRKPDVSARLGDTRIAFEVQLSTTFLDVIAERRQFYLREGGLLFWVFAKFDEDGRRLTQDDVFYNNNQNAFLVSEATRNASRDAGDFLLNCVWSEPGYSDSSIVLRRQQVSFRDLTLDLVKQQAFFFDYAGTRRQREVEEVEERASWPRQFESWWLEQAAKYESLYDQEDDLARFPDIAPVHWNDWGMLTKTPLRFYGASNFLPVDILDAFYSAKHGKPVGINRKQFIEVAHWFVPANPAYLLWFRRALQVWNRGDLLREQDRSGNWAKRVRGYKQELKQDPEKFDADQRHQLLFEWLFPELLPLPLFVGDV
ncbi:MAG: DUF6035 family protein [Hydrogenophaga sp.]|uniref:DUF6035 family protein n=1 Tax=Hydrogenophaga sp. TaxID=1904254 RepID=UPI004036C8E5